MRIMWRIAGRITDGLSTDNRISEEKSSLDCGVAVGLYFLLLPHFGTETLSWMCLLGPAPFALIGFVKYNGMTAEQFLWAWIKSEYDAFH